jgi:hypothetical protein
LKIDNDKNEAVEEMANRKGQIHKHLAEIWTTNSTTSKATSSWNNNKPKWVAAIETSRSVGNKWGAARKKSLPWTKNG